MNRMTATAIVMAFTVWPGLFAHAQPASTLDAGPHPIHRAGGGVIHCAHHDAGPRTPQPCNGRQTGEALRLGSDVSRQQFDCILSGVCGGGERGRVNG